MTYAQSQGCYKVILDCADDNAAFYEKSGFKRKEVQMVSMCRLICVATMHELSASVFALAGNVHACRREVIAPQL